jgi:allantoin racemase
MAEINTINQSNFLGDVSVKTHVRLILLHPVSPPGKAEGPFTTAPRPYLLPKTQVDEIYCAGAPSAINDAATAERVSPLVVAKARWAESEGYDAVVVGCMIDPGVQEAKRVISIPIIGIGEATRTVAPLIGINPGHIYPEGIPVLELATDREKTYSELVKVSRWLIAKRGVDVLIPNCGYLGGLAHRLQSEVGVPVLPNVDIGLKMGELLAALNVHPEQPWVSATKSPKWIQMVSRIAWQMRHWIRRK